MFFIKSKRLVELLNYYRKCTFVLSHILLYYYLFLNLPIFRYDFCAIVNFYLKRACVNVICFFFFFFFFLFFAVLSLYVIIFAHTGHKHTHTHKQAANCKLQTKHQANE